MKIVVVGLGYVGLSNALLLAQHNEVIGVDVSTERVSAINERRSPISDPEITNFLSTKKINLSASKDLIASVKNADYVIVATPTDYDEFTNSFDTSSVDEVIKQVVETEPDACIVIKSTIPVGYVENVKERLKTEAVFFSPEFLREGRALYDNLYPSRIIVGEVSRRSRIFASLLIKGAIKKDIKVLYTGASEAEAIKLFSNTYLAMRVAFFNELDSYALSLNLDTSEIISGVVADPRIGDQYKNPSFGYGGYCLPKDTKQLLANYKSIPQNLIKAVVDANETRKEFIVDQICSLQPKAVGIYRLSMKKDSDNFRSSSVLSIVMRLKEKNIDVLIFEPELKTNTFNNLKVEKDFTIFANSVDLIIANRISSEISSISNKVFTRDIFKCD